MRAARDSQNQIAQATSSKGSMDGMSQAMQDFTKSITGPLKVEHQHTGTVSLTADASLTDLLTKLAALMNQNAANGSGNSPSAVGSVIRPGTRNGG